MGISSERAEMESGSEQVLEQMMRMKQKYK
jgi:hypothetical protein